jgi:phosphate transport system protein
MTEHIVRSYDADLQALRRLIAEMGGISERMLGDSTVALVRGDTVLAQKVVITDPRLDALQREIEEKAVFTIARRQPLANDLREIISAIRLASDIERVGDLAKNIAKRAIAIAGQFQQPQKAVVGIEHMSRMVQAQLKDVLDAYAHNDEIQAHEVWNRDGQIDALYTSLFRELLTYMMEDPRNITLCTHLLFCAKNIERIGDHTTNIAETVHYLVKGSILEGVRTKGDTTNISLDPPSDN